MEFENYLDYVRKFMKETGQYTEKVNEMLDNLKKMEQDFQDFQKYNEDQTIENACILVLFGNNIALLCSIASLSKAVSEMKPIESKLPKSLQPKVEEIRSYLKSMEEKNEEIDSTIKQIATKFKELKSRKYKITEEEKTELEMLVIDLEGDLKVAENYQNHAEEALQSLQSDLTIYLIKEGIITAGASALIAAAAAGAGGATAYATRALEIKNVAKYTGILTGGAAFLIQLYLINGKSEERKTEVNELKKQLNIIKRKMEAQQITYNEKSKKKVDKLLKRQ